MSDRQAPEDELVCRLGDDGFRRLRELISAAGGLTPAEARPWFELSMREWQRVEHLTFIVLDDLDQRGAPLTWHLVRWLEHIRDRSGPTSSLFEGMEI